MAEGGYTCDNRPKIQACKDTCSICLEQIREGRILPCHHIFCSLCLIGYVEKCLVSGMSNIIPCPLCRAEIHVLNYEKASKIDDISKLDLLSFSLIASENESRQVTDDRCQPCKRGKENVRGIHYCSDCRERICSNCVTHHLRNKLTCNHTVSNIEIEHKTKCEDITYDYSTKCKLHSRKNFKYVCINHNILCCTKCVIEGGHRTCSNVKSLAEFGKSKEYETMVKTVRKLNSTVLKKCEKLKQEQLKNISTVANKTLCFMKATRQLEREILSEVSKMINEQRTPVLDKLKLSKEMSSKAVQTIGDIELRTHRRSLYLNQIENEVDITVNVAVMCEAFKRLECDKKFVVDIASTCENVIPNMELEIHPITNHFMENLRSICHRLSSENCVIIGHEGIKRPTLKYKKPKSEKLNDIAILQNGNAVIVDNTNSLTVIDSSLKELTKIELPSQPTCVTEFKRNIVSVALPSQKCLAVIKFSKSSHEIKMINTEKVFTCLASCIFQSNQVILAYDAETRSLWKQIVRSSINNSFENFSPNLNFVHKMSIDGITQMVYVSQPKLNRIIGLNCQGQQKFAFTHQRLHRPLGIFLGSTDKLFVCCYGTQQINELTLSTRELKDVICGCEGLVGPIAVSFDASLKRCLVYDCEKGKELKLFDF